MQSRFIKLAFLELDSDEPFMNRLTAWVSKNKVFHVELGFENNEYFSIMYKCPLSLRPKTLDNPHYNIHTLQITPLQYTLLYNTCTNLTKRDIQFDSAGLWYVYLYKLCCCFSEGETNLDDVKHTFCSKIITQVLQHIGLPQVMHLHPESTSPSDLLEAIKHSHNNVIDAARINRPYFKLTPNF